MARKDAPAEGIFNKGGLGDIFGGSVHAPQKDRVREYVIHRIEEGAHLENIIEEDYVRRNCTPPEISEILRDPRLVHAARESMEHAFSSGELDPRTNL